MMKSSLTLLQRLTAFLGRDSLRLLALGAAAGFFLFLVEVAFAYTLQAFLLAIGVMQSAAARLPAWMSGLDLKLALSLMVALGFARAFLNWAQTYLQGAAHEELRSQRRSEILRSTFFGESASASEVLTLFNSRADSAGFFAAALQTLAIQLTSAGLIACNLLYLAPRVTLLLGAALLVLVPPLRWADCRAKEAGEGLTAEWDRMSRRLITSIKNLLLLQIHGTLAAEEQAAQRSLAIHRRHLLSYYFVSGFKVGAPQAVGLLLVCLVALGMRTSPDLPPGIFVTYFYLFLRFVQTISTTNQSLAAVHVQWPATRQLLEWREANLNGLLPRAPGASEPPAPFESSVGWRVKDASFRYPGAASSTFVGLNLEIRAGSTLVITGASGCGKSTLLNLLIGGIIPLSGTVDVVAGGHAQPLGACRARLLQSVGYVGPESFLIEGTILENIAYGLPRAPRPAELDDALAKAECGFVRKLPHGLAHRLTEQGQGLSAGQKQRLGLARALLRRPTVLILDEATSNLDAETENRLIATLSRLKGGMTILAATHREAVLQLADDHLRLG